MNSTGKGLPPGGQSKDGQYVHASERKKLEAGGMRLAPQVLDAGAALALKSLIDGGYAPSKAGCVSKALIDAAKKFSTDLKSRDDNEHR